MVREGAFLKIPLLGVILSFVCFSFCVFPCTMYNMGSSAGIPVEGLGWSCAPQMGIPAVLPVFFV